MLLSFIRGIFIAYCTIYLYKKLMDISKCSAFLIISDVCFSALSGLLMYLCEIYLFPCRIVVLAIITFFYMTAKYKQPAFSAVAVTVIALGLSLLLFPIAGLLTYSITYIVSLFVLTDEPIFRIVAGLLQLLIAHIPFKSDRLKNGMPFLQNATFDEPCLLVGVLLIAGTTLIRTESDTSYLVGAVSFWRFRLIQTYLLRKEKEKAAALEQERRQLEAEADAAAYAASKERHRARRLAAAVQSMGDNPDMSISKTYIDPVDLILQYTAQRAEAEGVVFTFSTAGRVKSLFDGVLSGDELSTLFGDLLDNALAAVRYTDTKNVRLHIAAVNGSPVISIMDSGIDFAPDTIRRLGKECTTTHPGDGGSGLGLMSVFDTLRRHNASFELDETIRDREKLYTKAVLICFDGLGQTRIKSDRPEMIKIENKRTDILFLCHDAKQHI